MSVPSPSLDIHPRVRLLMRVWLPIAVLWMTFAWMVGQHESWLLMGPPGLLLIFIGWFAREPQRPLSAMMAGVLFTAIGFWSYAA